MSRTSWLRYLHVPVESAAQDRPGRTGVRRGHRKDRRRRLLLESLEGRRVLASIGTPLASLENEVAVVDLDDIGTAVVDEASEYSITGGVDASSFQIDAITGELSFLAAPDFETPLDDDLSNDYEVEVTLVTGAGVSDSTALSIVIGDVNESPTAQAGGPYMIDLDADLPLDASGSVDPDAGDTLSYQWDFDGDGTADFTTSDVISTAPGALVRGLTEIGENTITLTVVDSGMLSATDTATLTVSTPLVFQIPEFDPANPNEQDFTLVREGDNVELREQTSGQVVASANFENVGTIQIIGSEASNTLTVDQQGGPISRNIIFDGGSVQAGAPEAVDSLVITAADADRVEHRFDNASDGSIEVAFAGADSPVTIRYLNLEPITDNLVAAERVFTFSDQTETIVLADDQVADDGFLTIDSTLGEVVTFAAPTISLAIFAGDGDDTIDVDALDSAFAASLVIAGGDGEDTLEVDGLSIVSAPGRGLELATLENTTISNSRFEGNTAVLGAGLLVTGPGLVTIDDTDFIGNVATGTTATDGGGGIYNDGATITIQNGSQITGNTATEGSGSGGGIFNAGTLTVLESTITENVSNRAGGGIEATAGSTTNLTGVTLDRNNTGIAPATAAPGNGGGLHITGNGDATIIGGTVDGNVAGLEGGGLWNGSGTMTVSGTTITNNTASGPAADDGGGGIFNNGGTVEVTDVTITGNVADGAAGSGGGILNLGGQLTVTTSTLSANSAVRAGGGIEVTGGSTTTLNTVTVTNNSTGDSPGNGGGLHTTSDGTVTINGGTFTGNTAGAEGGGVWNSSTGTMTITGTTLTGNTASGDDADQGGGGVFNDGGDVTISGATISSNVADGVLGSGGGILNIGTLSATDTIITENVSNRAGGGIEGTAGSMTTLTRVDLLSNVTGPAGTASPGNGGGLHLTGMADVTISDSSVTRNVAGLEGGGLWNGSGTMTVMGSSIFGNTASGPAADDGGGGIFNNGGTVNVSASSIAGNIADGTSGSGGGVLNLGGTVSLVDSSITSNVANRAGGGIESTGGSTTNLTDVTLASNIAGPDGSATPGNGGGFHITGDGDAMIMRGSVTANFAALEGGGLWNGSGEMTVTGTNVSGNTASGPAADDGGGGIFNNGGTVVVSGASIGNNVADGASGSGGGVLNLGGIVTITDSSITANVANRAGGGIESTAGSTTTVTNTNVAANVAGPTGSAAPGNGGGFHISGDGDAMITGGSFTGNVAASEGGGVWNDTGEMTITSTSITGNTASGDAADNGGGGVFNNGGVVTISGATIASNIADGAAGSGGGILNSGTLTVTGTILSANVSNRAGGGIEATDATTNSVSTSTFIGNITGPAGSAAPGNGGGIHLSGTADATIGDSHFIGNVAASEGGGVWNSVGTMTVTDSDFIGNVASGDDADNGGGGLFNNGGTLNVTGGLIRGNVADGSAGSGGGILNDGGSMQVSGAVIDGNTANRAGGGIEDAGGTSFVISNTIVTSNFAGDAPGNGGGLHITGPGVVSVADSQFSENVSSNEGGGLWNSGAGTLNLVRTVISGNESVDGGGLFNDGAAGTITVTNSTISGNVATGVGGGIASESDSTILSSVTIAQNTATSGGGIEVVSGQVTSTGSIIASNQAASGPDVTGTLTSGGTNLIGDTAGATISGQAMTDLVDVDAGLAPLSKFATQVAGVDTFAHALLPTSPALGAGDTTASEDQRGVARPLGDGADIGAFESALVATDPPPAMLAIVAANADRNEQNAGTTDFEFVVTRSGNVDTPVTVDFAVTGSGTNPASAGDFASGILPSGTVTLFAGQTTATISIAVAGDTVNEPDETFTVVLSNASANTLVTTDSATGTIQNDDTVEVDSRVFRPAIVVGPQLIPADSMSSALIFQALADAVVTVTPVGFSSVTATTEVLDGNLQSIGVFSGGTISVAVEAGELYAILFDASDVDRVYSISSTAGPGSLTSTASTNILRPTDTNANGETTAADALLIINALGTTGGGEGEAGSGYLDVNGDRSVTALDALNVINRLARLDSPGANGEQVVAGVSAAWLADDAIMDLDDDLELEETLSLLTD